MATNIVALFDTPGEAQAAVQRLIDAGLPSSKISVLSKGEEGSTVRSTVDDEGNLAAEGAASGATSGTLVGGAIGLLAGLGIGAAVPFLGFLVAGPIAGLITGAVAGAATGGIVGGLIGLGIPKEEAETYAESIERGGTLVIAQADESQASHFEDLLQMDGARDVHEESVAGRQAITDSIPASTTAAYGSSGSSPSIPNSVNAMNNTDNTTNSYSTSINDATPTATDTPATTTNQGFATTTNTLPTDANERLEVVEEQLSVGKREVERGGVRVKTYVTETPVNEQIELREEHVNVERHPVDRPAGTIGDDAFTERTYELRETAEVPVVAKEARVVEEVLVGKTADTHTETISDTVRRKDVEIEQLDASFRQDFDSRYAGQNRNYTEFEPSYRYGAGLHNDTRYASGDYTTFENDVRADWEARNPGANWDSVKDTIRAGYDRARGNYAYADREGNI